MRRSGTPATFFVIAGAVTLIGACSGPARTTAIDDPDPVVSTPIRAATVRERTTNSIHAAFLPREDDEERWLHVTEVAEDAEGGVATGSFDPKGNKIRIRTEDVRGFAIDTSRISIDWDRLVVIRINGAGSELRKRDHEILHFVRNDHGRWEVAER